jgi:hypothetical protein
MTTCNPMPGPFGPCNPAQFIPSNPNCFYPGTRLLTPRHGDRKIEDFSIGDAILTMRGDDTVARITHRRSSRPEYRPVVLKRESLGPGLPYRDLRVSQEHALLIDGMLIRAIALVNGKSIILDPVFLVASYLHITVSREGPGIIYAEGVPCESMSRARGEIVSFNGRDQLKSYLRRTLAPLIDRRTLYDKVLDRIAHRATEVA